MQGYHEILHPYEFGGAAAPAKVRSDEGGHDGLLMLRTAMMFAALRPEPVLVE